MQSIIHSAYFSADISQTTSHFHDCHQLLLVQKGQIDIRINNRHFTANSGDLVIINRYEDHSIRILSDEYKRFLLRISPSAINSQDKVFTLFLNRPSGFHNLLDTTGYAHELTYLFKRILQEKENPAPLSAEMQQSLVNQLLILISRHTPWLITSLEEEKIELVFQLQKQFENHYDQRYTLEALAKEYHISPSSLSHQFKKIIGVSVFSYLHSCRMASAKRYLAKTDWSISEIVEKCGFSDNSNFSRAFKHEFGMTPSQFRKISAKA